MVREAEQGGQRDGQVDLHPTGSTNGTGSTGHGTGGTGLAGTRGLDGSGWAAGRASFPGPVVFTASAAVVGPVVVTTPAVFTSLPALLREVLPCVAVLGGLAIGDPAVFAVRVAVTGTGRSRAARPGA